MCDHCVVFKYALLWIQCLVLQWILKYLTDYPFEKYKCDLNDEHWLNFFKDLAKE